MSILQNLPWDQLIFLIGICLSGFLFFKFNQFEDESVRNNWTGRWEWLNQRGSWKNKWKVVDGSTLQFLPAYFRINVFGRIIRLPKQWWYFGIYPVNVERFTYSSTLFVFLTDPEHMFQFIKMRYIEIGLVLAGFLTAFPWWWMPLSWWIGVRIFALTKEKWLNRIN